MLAGAYGGGSLTLARHLADLMSLAVADLAVADPTKLYRRFLKWTLNKGVCCGACGKPGHAVIPGVPPRLVPCKGLRAVMAVDRGHLYRPQRV
jgi:hypothetical protein